jgi:hypothetical protein
MRRAALALAALTGLVARPAAAQPALASCATNCISNPSQVVITGSAALEPVLRRMAAPLKKDYGVDLYYIPKAGQCLGARHLVEGADLSGIGANHLGEMGEAGKDRCCNLGDQTKADIWVGDSSIEDCLGTKMPAGYRDFPGPIAAYSIVVPRVSEERAISIDEAYFVFGFGSEGFMGKTIAPWNDVRRVVIPRLLDGPRAVWAKFLRFPVKRPMGWPAHLVPPDAMKGQEMGDVEAVIPALLSPDTGGPGAIGLTSAQAYDSAPGADRIKVKALAIQSWKQKYAFYADSTLGAFDKRNVREGRYPFWAPTHIVLKADATGRPLSGSAEIIVNHLNQKVSMPTFNVLGHIVAGHLIPSCAMKVQRKPEAGDAGDLIPYTPPPGSACGCFMDDALSRGASGCTACSTSSPCSGGKMCSNGFCE